MTKSQLKKTAEKVAELSKEIKALEKELKPLKAELIKHAEEEDITETLDLGPVSIVPKSTMKPTMNLWSVSDPANWLYRLQQSGHQDAITVKPDLGYVKGDMKPELRELLNEAGFHVDMDCSFSIKINAI